MGDLEMVLKSTYGKSITVLYFPMNTSDEQKWECFLLRLQFPELLSSHLGNKVIGQMWERDSQRDGAEQSYVAPSLNEKFKASSADCELYPRAIYGSRACLKASWLTSGTRWMVSTFFWESKVQFNISCNFFLFTWHMCSKDSERWENNMGLINDRKKVSDLQRFPLFFLFLASAELWQSPPFPLPKLCSVNIFFFLSNSQEWHLGVFWPRGNWLSKVASFQIHFLEGLEWMRIIVITWLNSLCLT